ncbi:MAG: cbb3-type cytochrome c oxidase N-terminal domain-containing protein [Gemmatimonadota bacterium]
MTAKKKPEMDRLIEHSYDGIQEYDNPMPRWWVLTFWGTIIFSVLYALNVGGMGTNGGRIAAYEKDLAAARAAHPAPSGPTSPDQLLALTKDSHEVGEGKKVFAKNCASCHRPDAGGLIGPNLTDDVWLHGGKIDEINATITNGVLAKGMPPWGKMLAPREVDEVTAYVWSLHGTTPVNPKAPEGVAVVR